VGREGDGNELLNLNEKVNLITFMKATRYLFNARRMVIEFNAIHRLKKRSKVHFIFRFYINAGMFSWYI
jgi:hypothetical protein